MGVLPVQAALVRHCTHLLSVVLHTAVAPAHLVLFVPVHWTQAPLAAAQAAWAGSFKPAQSASPAHTLHFSLVPQMGVTPAQLAADVHSTQVLVATSQAGVVPVQEVAAVAALHCTH
jgi:hypothetical protein